MSQGFTFDFSNDDDTEEDADHDVAMDGYGRSVPEDISPFALIPPKYHSWDELLAALPATLSYATHAVPGAPSTALPRRELFDIRAQLMSEADPTSTRSDTAAGLSTDDITPGIYEGGFKTWECSLDLSRFVLSLVTAPSSASDRLDLGSRPIHLIELGAGTALPSSALLAHLCSLPSPPPSTTPPPITLTPTDFNPSVLRLASGPNLVLAALAALDLLLPPAAHEPPDIEPSPALLAALQHALQRRGIAIGTVSGAWGDAFVETVQRAAPRGLPARKPPLTVILASETIYAPASLPAFATTVLGLLRGAASSSALGAASSNAPRVATSSDPRAAASGAPGAGQARAFVAAKRVYFGVGGGVREFSQAAEALGGRVREVWSSEGPGVGRCILEVSLAALS